VAAGSWDFGGEGGVPGGFSTRRLDCGGLGEEMDPQIPMEDFFVGGAHPTSPAGGGRGQNRDVGPPSIWGNPVFSADSAKAMGGGSVNSKTETEGGSGVGGQSDGVHPHYLRHP